MIPVYVWALNVPQTLKINCGLIQTISFIFLVVFMYYFILIRALIILIQTNLFF